MARLLLAWVLLAAAALSVSGQTCPEPITNGGPDSPSEIRELQGHLLFHDGMRQWFELKLDKPQCGQTSIQVNLIQDSTHIEIFRGCRVRSRGELDYRTTGYISLEMYQNLRAIEPIGKCERKAPFPDYSKAKPDSGIRAYRVDMIFNNKRDRPIPVRVTSAGKPLRPWQAYASYFLTGVFTLYGNCGEGFSVDKVFGTPEANPLHHDPEIEDNSAMFDLDSAAAAGKWYLQLGYTCVRNP